VAASSSPLAVPLPCSVAEAVDPEEAFVASASSCHMLWFLSIAAKRGFVVESYVDEPCGIMAHDSEGKLSITQITLRPKIEFSAEKRPSAVELRSMHDLAHEECYIARSIRSQILVEHQ
jgi:organic hydroperoxide reductase OsmC/OhrA